MTLRQVIQHRELIDGYVRLDSFSLRECTVTQFLSASYSTDERRDEQPAVLQEGERRVPDHILDVVIETVGTCGVSQNGTKDTKGHKSWSRDLFCDLVNVFFLMSAPGGLAGVPMPYGCHVMEKKGEERWVVHIQGNQIQN